MCSLPCLKYTSTKPFVLFWINHHKTWKIWEYTEPGNEEPEKRNDGFWQMADSASQWKDGLDLVSMASGGNLLSMDEKRKRSCIGYTWRIFWQPELCKRGLDYFRRERTLNSHKRSSSRNSTHHLLREVSGEIPLEPRDRISWSSWGAVGSTELPLGEKFI